MRFATIPLLFVALASLFVPFTVMAQEGGEDIDITVPKPNIFVPGLQFTSDESILKQNVSQGEDGQTFVQIPFLAEYIAAFYRYAIGISGVIAVVITIISGFQWATSGGSPDVINQAKGRITNAITGLLLALGSYALLYAINPELVRFRALAVPYINETELLYAEPAIPLDTTVQSPRRQQEQSGGKKKATASSIAQEGHSGALRTIQYAAGAQINKPVKLAECPLNEKRLIGQNGAPQEQVDDLLFQKYSNCVTTDYRLLKAIARVESGYKPSAQNKVSCFSGLFQTKSNNCASALQSYTLSNYCFQGRRLTGENCGGRNPVHQSLLNPEISTMVGASILKTSLEKIQARFGTSCDQDTVYYLAYIGHHGGHGTLDYVLRNLPSCSYQLSCRYVYEFWQKNPRYRDNTPPPCAQP